MDSVVQMIADAEKAGSPTVLVAVCKSADNDLCTQASVYSVGASGEELCGLLIDAVMAMRAKINSVVEQEKKENGHVASLLMAQRLSIRVAEAKAGSTVSKYSALHVDTKNNSGEAP